jgi:hypothetical protein
MAQAKLQAGATIDVLNRKELREVLDTATRDWFNQVTRGDRYRRFSAPGTIAGGAVTIGGATARDAVLGPADGFVWAVQRLAVVGLVAADTVQLSLNDDGPAAVVHGAMGRYQSFGQYDLVLYPGDTLMVTGAALASTGTLTLTGQARELPMPLSWRLGG